MEYDGKNDDAETDRKRPDHLWEWAEDKCQVCGAHIRHCLRFMHIGRCDTCATATRH
jgi:hypothetical protein